MGIINLSAELYIVFTVGYICGVLLCWSLQGTIYGENNEQETKNDNRHLYSGIRHGNGGCIDPASYRNRPIDG